MSKSRPDFPRTHRNLWAPWRMEYIGSLSSGQGGCFLCHARDDGAADRANLLLWRGRRTLTVLNRFPYTSGHCLVAPRRHVADLTDLRDDELLEFLAVLRDLPAVLAKAIGAEGFNIGFNLGRCAGAGLPGHLHAHIVPRWSGDTNFMAVFGDVRVIPQSLEAMYDLLEKVGRQMNLPRWPSGCRGLASPRANHVGRRPRRPSRAKGK